MDDFTFTFDVEPFKTAIEQISKGFEALKQSVGQGLDMVENKSGETVQNTVNQVKKSGKQLKKNMDINVANFSDNSKKMINSLITKLGLLAAGFFSIRKALQYIPEVGRAFKHAGDIALRSFLWPLRRQLIPLLNKMLAWVRDHRAMFVRWGTVLANAFRTVFTIVKGIIGVVKTLVDSFISKFELIFGKTTNKLSDVMNILMFKFTVMIEYLLAVLKPVAEKIGSLAAYIAGLFKDFFEGFKEGLGDITPFIGDITDSLSGLWRVLNKINTSGGLLNKTFRTLGQILGIVLQPVLAFIAQSIDFLSNSIENLIYGIDILKAMKAGDIGEIARLREERKKISDELTQRTRERWSGVGTGMLESLKGLRDIWVTPKKETSRNEIIKEPIRVPAKTENKNIKLEAKIDMGKTEININTEGDAEKIGKQFATSMSQTLNQQLRKMLQDSNLGVASA